MPLGSRSGRGLSSSGLNNGGSPYSSRGKRIAEQKKKKTQGTVKSLGAGKSNTAGSRPRNREIWFVAITATRANKKSDALSRCCSCQHSCFILFVLRGLSSHRYEAATRTQLPKRFIWRWSRWLFSSHPYISCTVYRFADEPISTRNQ